MIQVTPKLSVGKIEIGAAISTVRELFNNDYKETVYGGVRRDSFQKSSFHVEYEDGKVAWVGVNMPFEAEYNNINLSELSYNQLLDMFRYSQEKYRGDETLTFCDLGIGFYFDDLDVASPKPKQVCVFADSYYNEIISKFRKIPG